MEKTNKLSGIISPDDKDCPPEGSKPPETAQPVGEGATGPSPSCPMDEVFRVNRLLQIEDLDWTHQLEQAVCGFLFSFCLVSDRESYL